MSCELVLTSTMNFRCIASSVLKEFVGAGGESWTTTRGVWRECLCWREKQVEVCVLQPFHKLVMHKTLAECLAGSLGSCLLFPLPLSSTYP